MAIAKTTFQVRIKQLVSDNSGILNAQYDDIAEAMLRQHSRYVPRIAIGDITGDGSQDYTLSSAVILWVNEFSQIVNLEYPQGERPPVNVDQDEWRVYNTDTTTETLQFWELSPIASETIRLSFTTPWVFDTSGNTAIPDHDNDALSALGAAIACEQLAAHFGQTDDPSINADVVNYRTKSDEWRSLAKMYREQYGRHFGISDDENRGALAIGDWDTQPGVLGEYITPHHRKEFR